MYLLKKRTYKWTCTVQTHVVQGSAVCIKGKGMIATSWKCLWPESVSVETSVYLHFLKFVSAMVLNRKVPTPLKWAFRNMVMGLGLVAWLGPGTMAVGGWEPRIVGVPKPLDQSHAIKPGAASFRTFGYPSGCWGRWKTCLFSRRTYFTGIHSSSCPCGIYWLSQKSNFHLGLYFVWNFLRSYSSFGDLVSDVSAVHGIRVAMPLLFSSQHLAQTAVTLFLFFFMYVFFCSLTKP